MKERVGLTTLVCQKRERKSLCKARDTGIVMCFRPLSDLENLQAGTVRTEDFFNKRKKLSDGQSHTFFLYLWAGEFLTPFKMSFHT